MQVTQSHTCGAKTRAGGVCKGKPRGNGRCRMHGGNHPSGIASPHYKHGLRSKYLTAIPSRLGDQYTEARQREDLLELNNEVALLDTRLLDVLKRVEQGEHGAPDALWIALQGAFSKYRAAQAKGAAGANESYEALLVIENLIEQGVEDAIAWREVYGILEQRRKLVESERKRAVEQQEMLTNKEAMLLFNALLSVVNAHVTDRDTKSKIQSDFIRITSQPNSGGLRLAG